MSEKAAPPIDDHFTANADDVDVELLGDFVGRKRFNAARRKSPALANSPSKWP